MSENATRRLYVLLCVLLIILTITLRGIPNYDYKKGKLTFTKGSSRPKEAEKGESQEVCMQFLANLLFALVVLHVQSVTFEPFSGKGATIRQKRKPNP